MRLTPWHPPSSLTWSGPAMEYQCCFVLLTVSRVIPKYILKNWVLVILGLVLFVAEASQLACKPVPEHKSLPLCQKSPFAAEWPTRMH